jgi:hypothetical protein
MRNCPRIFCTAADCGEEMIHRDNRRFYESASAFGQIVNRPPARGGAPRDFGCGDVDLFIHRQRFGITLLRWIEHKQPRHKFEESQRHSLSDFDRLLRHSVEHPPDGLVLHPDCGVFVLRGPLIVPTQDNPHRRVDFAPGEVQTLESPDGTEIRRFDSRADLYDWMRGLDGSCPRWRSSA